MDTIVGENVRARRLSLGWSEEDLSEASGVSRRTIQNIEAGSGNPSMETVKCLSAALDLRSVRSDRRSGAEMDEAEVQVLMSYWVAPADDGTNGPSARRLASTILWMIASLCLVVAARSAAVPDTVLLAPMLSAAVAFAFLMQDLVRKATPRTESDVDDERASFRERLRRDGPDAWRIPDGPDDARTKPTSSPPQGSLATR